MIRIAGNGSAHGRARGRSWTAGALVAWVLPALALSGLGLHARAVGTAVADKGAQGPSTVLTTGTAAGFDLVIRNARLLDGSGNPWVRADIGVRGDRIVAVGRLGDVTAPRIIDAAGRYVAPGFIDVHTHAAEGLTREGLEQGRPLLAQGVTTIVINPDGGGPTDLAAQRRAFEARGIGPNVAQLIGHGSVRRAVMGLEDRAPTAEELDRMRALVRRGMAEGAFGLSSGLFYAPGSYASTDEVVELMRVVAGYGGLHASHIRDEGDYTLGLLASVDEIIEIAERTGTRGVLTHLKALGSESWGLSMAVVSRVERARARGVEIFADQYPYEASSTSLVAALVPRWAESGGPDALRERLRVAETRARIRTEIARNIRRRGGPARLVIAAYGPDPTLEGRSLADIATATGQSPEDAVLALIERGNASVVSFNMTEADIELFMRQPWTMTSSDGVLVRAGEGRPHPRGYGAFARKIARYVRERRVVGLEFAVRSMTSLPAIVFRLADRGVVRPGAFADLVLFDLDRVEDVASYADPHHLARGVDVVLVNGRVVLEDGTFTDALPGRVLRPAGAPAP